ncbi:hypothetical protein AB990_14030 [Alkalihalobacillus pseudalcaliphilus]|nr:hypothetical protein AB990_14030 [Alkalihalobacillus pseudalcaliphilus]
MKKWVIIASVYLIAVFGGYGLLTGENPFKSGAMNHQEHAEGHEPKNESDGHGNHAHQEDGPSEIEVSVSYVDNELTIELMDDEGNAPTLSITHEKEMHAILVSSDLKEYIHLHPENKDDGIFVVEESLSSGQYEVFIDIKPSTKNYEVEAIPLNIGETSTPNASLTPDEEWTKDIEGKKVTLEPISAKTGEEVLLKFDLHGEKPEKYLGALGHVVIIDEQVEDFIHVHPTSEQETNFITHFSKPGLYKVWAEFKFEGKVNAYPFVIEVQ